MENKSISMFGIILIIFGLYIVISNLPEKQVPKEISKLESILKPLVENTTIVGGNCLNYTLYYQDYLNKNYPQLDVRKIDRAGICKIGMGCGEWDGMLHTYLIVNGFGSEAILDQKQYVIINVIKMKNE